MFRTIHMIDPGLFISGVGGLQPMQRLHDLGIKAVCNAAQENLYHIGWSARDQDRESTLEDLDKHFEVLIVGAEDCSDCNLSEHFEKIAGFMERGRALGGVVVHCAAGISRASTSACAYLMLKEHWSLTAAFKRVHSVRNFVSPNQGFWRQLRDLEASLIAQGVELKELPADWEPCPQPEAARLDMSALPDMSDITTASLIAELDADSRFVESFTTRHLMAVLDPEVGTSVSELTKQMENLQVGGVRLDDVDADAASVTIRVGLVPSLDADSFKALLFRMPGVGDARVEGESGP